MALILLAEDETSTIDHVRSVLASQGWLVKTVKSHAQALRAASEFAPQLVLLNDELEGVDDLVRTFSRRSGGPGVVLLTTKKKSPRNGEDIEAVLTKPVQTEELIATIQDKLSLVAAKKASSDVETDVRILSSEEIFGDLLDEILDKPEPEPAVEPDRALTEEATAVSEAAATEASEPADAELEEAADEIEAAATSEEDDLVDLSDLEELAKEAVPALVDAVEAQARKSGKLEEQLDVAKLLRDTAPAAPPPEPPPAAPVADDLDEDLEARLSDTLAGVLAASLGAAADPETTSAEADGFADDVADLLSQALGDLDVGGAKVPDMAAATTAAAAQPTAEPKEESKEEPPEETISDLEAEVEEIPEEAETSEEAIEPVSEEEPEPAAAPKPMIEFGEYTLEERIGIGGMAEVWKARRKGVEGFEKRVAIKKILPQPAENQDFVDMFIDEAKLAAQLNHQNITHIYDLGKVEDDYYIAMEYVEGENLRRVLALGRRRERPLPAGLALYIASRIADALEYAHRSKDFNNTELGLVHRDVSPHNVLISHEGDIKLCDFGIAKASSKISTTQMGALKGKLQYMSPEQAWGRFVDHRSDIFSTGTLLFEMLTGERLFTGESELAVLEAVRECETAETVIQDQAIPSRIKGLLLKALAKDPDERFDTSGELLTGLEELLAEFEPTPGQKDMSRYVRELLDLPDESARASEPESSEPAAIVEEITGEISGEIAAVASEPAAILLEETPDADEDEEASGEEGKRRPAFLKWLSRLLPVVAVLAIGGYLIAGRVGQSPDPTPSTATARPKVVETQTFRPEAVEASLPSDPGVAEGIATTGTETAEATPSAPAEEQQTPAPPPQAQQQIEEPVAAVGEAEAVSDGGTAAEQAPVEVADSEPLPDTQAAGTDPELERRVEEDLQRVQELISTPDFAVGGLQGESPASEPISELAEPAADDQDVSTDETEAVIQEAEFTAATEDVIAETFEQSDFLIAEETASLDSTVGGFEDSPPLAGEGGEPPETSAPETTSEAVDSSPDLPIAPPAEESTATQPGDLVEQGPGVIQPQVLSFQPPAYSQVARRVGVTGTVRVAVLVDENGQVQEARLVEGLRQKVGLDEQTLAAARRATFRPATKDGVAVKMWHELAVQFQP